MGQRSVEQPEELRSESRHDEPGIARVGLLIAMASATVPRFDPVLQDLTIGLLQTPARTAK